MRRPAERNVIFIGLPGAGKTTVGGRVAEALKREFFDSDAELEKREGLTCAELINMRGEEYFRTVERAVVAELCEKRGVVLAVGGGAPTHCEEIGFNSVVVMLERPPEDIAASLDGESRPLSKSLEDLRRLWEARKHDYHRYADVRVDDGCKTAESAARCAVDQVTRFLRGRLLVINGPNLNMLGTREPGVYGAQTYSDLTDMLTKAAEKRGIAIGFTQSNSEGGIIDRIQGAYPKCDGVILNPGAYTHYSYAIYDALKSVPVPAVEVHISNIHAREEFRRASVTAGACVGQISGLGFYGYVAAMDYLLQALESGI
jgi:3-dehydroquinate dehydratase-2